MDIFESSLPPSSPTTTRASLLEALVREKLETAHNMVAASESSTPVSFNSHSNTNSLLNEMGDYMNRLALVSAKLTEGLVSGEHINHAAMEVHMQAQRDTHLADLSSVAALDVQLDRLRKMRDLTYKWSRDVEAIWRPETQMDSNTSPGQPSISPFVELKHATLGLDDGRSRTRRSLPGGSHKDQRSPKDHGSGSEASDDGDEELFQSIDMAALGNRGKGSYYCPKAHACTKGGVDKFGNLVAFERNSSFVQHCNKHRKPYRCTKEHCPNPPKKRRFARRDGLERHLNTVSHAPPHLDVPDTTAVKAESS